jgi:histidinol-phosphate aminotransferase
MAQPAPYSAGHDLSVAPSRKPTSCSSRWGRGADTAVALLRECALAKAWRESGCEQFLHASIGRPAENDRLIAALSRLRAPA